MSDYVQLVGTDTPDAIGSCCLVSDDRRILFNCPEGTQRHFSEARLRVSKTSQFLFTRITVDTMMGLPGFLFTINDCGIKACSFGGPIVELERFVRNTWRSFYGYRNMTAEIVNYQNLQTSPVADHKDSTGRSVSLSQEPRLIFRGGRVPNESKNPSNGDASPKVHEGDACGGNGDESTENPLGSSHELWYRHRGTPLFKVSNMNCDIFAFYVGTTSKEHDGAKPSTIVSYLIVERFKPIFLVAKAKELGVRPGPKFAKLKAGEDVWSDEVPPKLVKAVDVTCSPERLLVSLVLDGDDVHDVSTAIDYAIPALLGSIQAGTNHQVQFVLQNVFHLAKQTTVSSDAYCNTVSNSLWWRSRLCGAVWGPSIRFSDDSLVRHVLYHEAAAHVTAFPTAMVHRVHLAALAPRYFPMLTKAPQESSDDVNDDAPFGGWGYQARYLLLSGPSVASPPTQKRQTEASTTTPEITRYPTWSSAMSMLSEPFRAKYLPQLCVDPVDPSTIDKNCADGAVTFLGTGSSVPSKYRNVSGILVSLPRIPTSNLITQDEATEARNTRMMLDCGEGTLGQLRSIYCLGPHRSSSVEASEAFLSCLASIEVIFISHSHADHNLGLLSVIQRVFAARKQVRGSFAALTIIAPQDFMEYVFSVELLDLHALQQSGELHIDTFTSRGPMLASCPWQRKVRSLEPSDSGAGGEAFVAQAAHALAAWCTRRGFVADIFPVDHPAHAHGIAFRSKIDATFSLLYSGDCRPTPRLIQRGLAFGPLKLLIHEATFDDSLEEEAKAKSHSTTGEAIAVAAACGAKHLILTHFSQRYPKLPPPSASASIAANSTDAVEQQRATVMFSFDYMTIPLDAESLRILPTLTETFLALLAEYDSWDSGTSKRMRE